MAMMFPDEAREKAGARKRGTARARPTETGGGLGEGEMSRQDLVLTTREVYSAQRTIDVNLSS